MKLENISGPNQGVVLYISINHKTPIFFLIILSSQCHIMALKIPQGKNNKFFELWERSTYICLKKTTVLIAN